jgi:hypothetical protein
VIPEHGLDIGDRFGEGTGSLPHRRSDGLGRVTASLGLDADVVERLVSRVLGELFDGGAQLLPWLAHERW